MKKLDHLLVVLSEESHEISQAAGAVGQAASKALRFGLDDGYPGTSRTNIKDMVAAANALMREAHDMVATMELLREAGCEVRGFEPLGKFDRASIDRKKIKVEHYLEYSRNKGRLAESE